MITIATNAKRGKATVMITNAVNEVNGVGICVHIVHSVLFPENFCCHTNKMDSVVPTKKVGDLQVYDVGVYIKSLRRFPKILTSDLLQKYAPGVDWSYYTNTGYISSFGSSVTNDPVCFSDVTVPNNALKIDNGNIISLVFPDLKVELGCFDMFCDIKVYGGDYAYLQILAGDENVFNLPFKNYTPDKLHSPNIFYWKLEGFTKSSPLWRGFYYRFRIVTNGYDVFYRVGTLSTVPTKEIKELSRKNILVSDDAGVDRFIYSADYTIIDCPKITE